MKKTGLFGGSFNPVHRGHVQLVTTIRAAFSLASVVVIPSAAPPHKDVSNLAPPEDRLEMTRLAFASEPACTISEIEVKRQGRSYTIDTVTELMATLPETTRLFLIMGLDSFLELDTWKDFRQLVKTVPLIVVNRILPGQRNREAFYTFLTTRISPGYLFSKKEDGWFHDTFQPVYFYEPFIEDISSTSIRRQIEQTGRPPADLLPPAVAAFIKQKEMYQCPTA
jgi:nicotinate-nucleotide adenylyltransferase